MAGSDSRGHETALWEKGTDISNPPPQPSPASGEGDRSNERVPFLERLTFAWPSEKGDRHPARDAFPGESRLQIGPGASPHFPPACAIQPFGALAQQFLDDLAPVQDGHGAAGVVGEAAVGVDAEDVVDGLQQVLGPHGALAGGFALAVGGADDLAHLEAAAGDECGHGAWPVVSTAVGDAWGAAELAPDEDEDAVGQSALVEIVDEGRDGGIELGELFAALGEDLAVMVPVVVVGDGDEGDTGFDQPARAGSFDRGGCGRIGLEFEGLRWRG